jgi:GTP-binding protein
LDNLVAQFYTPRLIAENGRPGMGKGMDGRAGQDLLVKVPCGTLVWRLSRSTIRPQADGEDADQNDEGPAKLPLSGGNRPVLPSAARRPETPDSQSSKPPRRPDHAGPDSELVADLTIHGSQFVLCKGGRGGLGNRNFATARRQTPRFAQPGEPGDAGEFLFELRMVADVGLVGYPNAGKSTLLSAISKARPKIAPYPFTTLHPQIGIVEYEDGFRLVVCDVPGLIEGAHENVGLGHAFLRHIQRCKLLALILDMGGTDGRAPWDDYKQLLKELELHDPELVERPRVVIGNKMDEPSAAENLRAFKRKIRKTPVLGIAAGFGEGIDEFKDLVRAKAAEAA